MVAAPRRNVALGSAAVVLVIAGGGCGNDSTTSTGEQPSSQYGRIEPYRRAPDAARTQLTSQERAKVQDVIATDPSLDPLLEDGEGYSIGQMGPIRGGGRGFIIGAGTEIRLSAPVNGTYTLPLECYGTTGPFALQPTDFSLRNVRVLQVSIAFADGKVVAIDPFNRNYDQELAPGASWPSVPHTCRKQARKNAGE